MIKKEFILQFYPAQYAWLTEIKKIEYDGVYLKSAYLIDLMHYFITRSFLFDKTEFNLWSPLLQQKYGMRYKYYFRWLIGNGIIDIKSKWYSGKKSITYRLALDLQTAHIKRHRNNDKILLKKWEMYHSLERADVDEDLKKLRVKLIEDLFYVELDYDAAKDQLQKEFDIGLIDQKSYSKNLMTLDSINCKQVYWNFDKYGRLHTNFTILKKSIRNNFLTINKNKISEVDISNSQPFFLAILLKKNLNSKQLQMPEFIRFFDYVENGKFYDSFADLDISRKDVKKFVYKILFDKNYITEKKNIYFREKWPLVWQWIRLWKKERDNHAALAWELQKQESEFIFKKVCADIKEQLPDTRIFTVHDSVFFPIEHKNHIKKLFNIHLKSAFKV